MEKTYFDGRAFEDMGLVVERVHDPIPDMREETQARPDGHGVFLDELAMNPREITLECRYFGDEWQDFDDMMDELAAWLITEDERPLVLRTRAGQHYMAHFSSYSEGDREGGSGIGGFELTFVASDPVRYGEGRSLVTSSSIPMRVGGTERADMTITCKNVRKGSGDMFGIRLRSDEHGSFLMKVAVKSGGTHEVTFDVATRSVLLDGAASGLTLDSDWPDVRPGKWIASVEVGSGTATLSWTQRYR